ncbi:Spo0E family sporulation regulatory protein-aspartic acid phosphatase [Bacillus salinus]|uniref:Spo0E family sporulation regulatory protein-aspartic acid phosphatase n=1 Tax=Bacillus sp. HMF5848 TaxID=2495421 RepID=UPI0037C017D8
MREKQQLQQSIEDYRQILMKKARQTPTITQEVIEISQLLDKLIADYQYLMVKHQKIS